MNRKYKKLLLIGAVLALSIGGFALQPYKMITVIDQSMAPTFSPGNVIWYKSTTESEHLILDKIYIVIIDGHRELRRLRSIGPNTVYYYRKVTDHYLENFGYFDYDHDQFNKTKKYAPRPTKQVVVPSGMLLFTKLAAPDPAVDFKENDDLSLIESPVARSCVLGLSLKQLPR